MELGVHPNERLLKSAMGHGLPPQLCQRHGRCNPDSCLLAAAPKSAASGQDRKFDFKEPRQQRSINRDDLASRYICTNGV
jgi:hypothetical protein